jgi:ribosome biogenesis protein Nip4
MGEMRRAYNILVGKPEGKMPLGRPRDRWESNIRTDIREIGCKVVDWMYLAQGRDQWQAVVNTVMNLRVP